MIKVKVEGTLGPGISPYRLIDAQGQGIKEANEYLDSIAARGLSERSLRTYAYDLLNFWKWLISGNIEISSLNRGLLLEYVRYQKQGSNPVPKTINHRLITVKCLYQHHFNRHIPVSVHNSETDISFNIPRTGYRRTGWMHGIRTRQIATRVKEPCKVMIPLNRREVITFFESLKSWRDIAMTGFMLFCGLRSMEVITLKMDDINIINGQFRVHGKGNRERIVPLPKDLLKALNKYLNLERPETDSEYLFLNMKGPNRGKPLPSEALRNIFRYHRKISGILNANAHRFRHTFGANMARTGVPIPVLMKLMGHSHVQTTMIYVNLCDEDIRMEFNRAVEKLQEKDILHDNTASA
jgi:site-specific recombinase XerD